jgi:hypothetical protein
VVGEQPAYQRAEHRGDAEHRAQRTLVLASFAQRDYIGDHRRRGHRQPPGAEALHRSPADEPRHVAGETAHRGRQHEGARRQLEDELAPEQVTELTGEHRRDRVGQQVRRHDPGQMPRSAQIPDDRRQRRGHDRLVQGRQQHPEQHRDEHQIHPPSVHNRLGHRRRSYLERHQTSLRC